mmetsp:Transcript_5958/g.8969  ORF Transcript_5958/g.8969 Transcript_5958/m.8969 type:complete len:410 (-) Transcript_5958:107-1336(-)
MSELLSAFERLKIDIEQYGTDISDSNNGFNYSMKDANSHGQNGPNLSNESDRDDDIEGKLFIGGISWQTTEEGLSSYFSQFGNLSDVALMKDKYTGQPRGFGFIKFEDSSRIDAVLAHGEHTINGRAVDVKRAVKKSEAPGPSRNLRPMESNKVFVGGLAPSVSVNEFRQYFETFGQVVDAVVMFDRQTQRSRGFGFVTFHDPLVVQAVLMGIHEINGKMVEVKQAEPKEIRRNPITPVNYQNSMSYRPNLYANYNSTRSRQIYQRSDQISPYLLSGYRSYIPSPHSYNSSSNFAASETNGYIVGGGYGGSLGAASYADESGQMFNVSAAGNFNFSQADYGDFGQSYQSLLSNYEITGTNGHGSAAGYFDYEGAQYVIEDDPVVSSQIGRAAGSSESSKPKQYKVHHSS